MSITPGASRQHGRIVEEVERCIRMLHTILDTLEAELTFAMGLKNPGLPKGCLTQMKEAVACLNSLTDSKVRLDKSAKLMADSMTSEEETEAVRSFVRGMSDKERAAFLGSL